MKNWEQPKIWSLGVENTMGNPGAKGNDQFIPDCIEHFFDPTGPVTCKKS